MPALATSTAAPAAKLPPVRVASTLVPWTPLAGLSEVSAGPDGLTVKTAAPLTPPLVVTVTFAAPGAALAAMVNVAAI